MTGKELIEKIQELGAEDMEVMIQPRPGYAYMSIDKVQITLLGIGEVLGIRIRH